MEWTNYVTQVLQRQGLCGALRDNNPWQSILTYSGAFLERVDGAWPASQQATDRSAPQRQNLAP